VAYKDFPHWVFFWFTFVLVILLKGFFVGHLPPEWKGYDSEWYGKMEIW